MLYDTCNLEILLFLTQFFKALFEFEELCKRKPCKYDFIFIHHGCPYDI